MKIGYQLKQVRERLAKGLVDKGILRTEKRNFLLFDMATHPVVDSGAKDEIRKRVRNICSNRTVVLPPSQFLPAELDFRYLRTIAMVCASYAANVLENALVTMGHETRERAFAHVDELLAEYSQYPFAKRQAGAQGIGANLSQAVTEEVEKNKDRELQLEVRIHRWRRSVRANSLLGRCRLFERLHETRFASVESGEIFEPFEKQRAWDLVIHAQGISCGGDDASSDHGLAMGLVHHVHCLAQYSHISTGQRMSCCSSDHDPLIFATHQNRACTTRPRQDMQPQIGAIFKHHL